MSRPYYLHQSKRDVVEWSREKYLVSEHNGMDAQFKANWLIQWRKLWERSYGFSFRSASTEV